MIEVKNLVKKYGQKAVVNDVSLTIERGKITSFIGPNGAGKSTVLSMMSRIMKKDSGEVVIDGIELEKWNTRELAKKVSILKQANNINVRLTIREIVSFGRYPHCEGRLTKNDIEHIDKAIEYMQLKDIENRYLDELSGGQRQRAYIAMVIAQDTEYVFLDEPLNNLDMKHSVQMMKVLRSLVDELGKTVVIVMHDINFASVYSDRIIILKDGKVAKEAVTKEVIQKGILEDIYEINFNISNINGNDICVYY